MPSWGFGAQGILDGGLGAIRMKEFFGMFVGQQFTGPWYWVTSGIFRGNFPIKGKHCKTTVYCIVAL